MLAQCWAYVGLCWVYVGQLGSYVGGHVWASSVRIKASDFNHWLLKALELGPPQLHTTSGFWPVQQQPGKEKMLLPACQAQLLQELCITARRLRGRAELASSGDIGIARPAAAMLLDADPGRSFCSASCPRTPATFEKPF